MHCHVEQLAYDKRRALGFDSQRILNAGSPRGAAGESKADDASGYVSGNEIVMEAPWELRSDNASGRCSRIHGDGLSGVHVCA